MKIRSSRARALWLLAVLLPGQSALAQSDAPVLRAKSGTVDIRDGDVFLKGAWAIDPGVALDVYEAKRTSGGKRVTFISDVDSLSFDVRPGSTYDFIISIGGTDTCRTRISTMKQGYLRAEPNRTGAPDTIAFASREGRILVTVRINESKPLELLFDTGANIVSLRPSAIAKGATLTFDGSALNTSFGGSKVQRTSSDNRLELAGLYWEHESILYFDRQAHDPTDGILGYNVFEDKVVEIDHDRNLMIIHESVPASAAGYTKFAMSYNGGLPTLETTFHTGRRPDHGKFVIDTGATAALQLKQEFAKEHGLYGVMERIDSSTARGAGGGKVRNEVVRLPELAFGPFILRDVPTHLELPTTGTGASSDCLLGMDVLKRFNTILDYQRSAVYLKPNGHFSEPFRTRFSGPPKAVVVAIVAILAALFLGWALRGARR